MRYRRELGEDADELAAAAGERLGEAGMRAWRSSDVGAATSLARPSDDLMPSGLERAALLWERGDHATAAGSAAEATAA